MGDMKVLDTASEGLPYLGNLSFSGTDTVATLNISIPDSDGNLKTYCATLGSLQTLSYSMHMDRHPIRTIGNVNAKDYVMGPRTIAGTLVFTVFNRHWTRDLFDAILSGQEKDEKIALLADELPPFDIVISLANEYGAKARLVIYGVRLVNEGQVMSVNDVYTENTYQYFANDIEYLSAESDTVIPASKYGRRIYIESNNKSKTASNTSGKELKSAITSAKTLLLQSSSVIMLGITTAGATKNGGKGIAKFTLTPRQKTGLIKINGKSNFSLNIEVSKFLNSDGFNGTISVELSPGEYSAVYENKEENIKSNVRSFFISDYIAIPARIYPAPIITNRTEDSISVLINSYGYTNVSYAKVMTNEEQMVYSTIKAINGKAVIANLIPGTKYRVFAINDANMQSASIEVLTLNSNLDPYIDMKQYMFSNKDKLISGTTLLEYYSCIDMASNIAMQQLYRMSIHDALYNLKVKLAADEKLLNNSSFNTEDEYNEAVARMKKNILITNHLIVLSDNKVNNEHYVLNYSNADIKPIRQPEIIDSITNTIRIPEEASKLDIYAYGTDRLVKSVNSKSVNKEYKLLGKPGTKFYAYASNTEGEKSPKLEFFVYDDEDKAKYITIQKENINNFNSNYSLSESEIANKLSSLRLNENDYKDIVITHGKSKCIDIAYTPVITDYTESSITINISMLDIVGNNGLPYFAVIAERDKVFNNDLFRKQEFHAGDEIVKFTAEKDVVRPDKTYLFWIEDHEQKQISKAAMLNIQNDELSLEKKKSYSIDSVNEYITKSLTLKGVYSTEVGLCIQSALDDEDVNVNNLYDKIIEKIITYNSKFLNESFIIKAILEIKIESKSVIDDFFFNTNFKIDTSHRVLITPMKDTRYTVTVYKVNTEGVVYYDSILVDALSTQNILLDRMYKYMCVFCIAMDPAIKSDIIFIDTIGDLYGSLKNKVEVI